jgi:hypothetical protein
VSEEDDLAAAWGASLDDEARARAPTPRAC